ncbi:MAG: hypothetical protein P8Z37_05400 [Acidobacteriota bacterium]
MKASQIDRSNYFRGLLVLIGRDRIIHPTEHNLALQFGKALDFEKRFCEATIADLLDNEHINEDPIIFDEHKIAECFLRDALKFSLIDKEIHSREMAWLEIIARTNNLPDDWLEKEYRKIKKTALDAFTPETSEIYRYL